MGIITLTSDLGTRDYYVAALKGAIFSQCGDVKIVDVTHAIKTFDIKHAAFTIKNSYSYFPKKTIHVVHLNGASSSQRLLLALVDDHYFLSFDNGLLSLIFDLPQVIIYQVNDEFFDGSNLLAESAIAKVCDLLLKDYLPTDFAHPVTDHVSFKLMQPVKSQGFLRATVVHIDQFGNAVLNVDRSLMKQLFPDGKFMLQHGSHKVYEISKSYSDVEEGDLLCLYNAAGYLELAINKGKAEHLLGLKIDSSVLISRESG